MEGAFGFRPHAAYTLMDKAFVTALRKEKHVAYVKAESCVLLMGCAIELPTQNASVLHYNCYCFCVLGFCQEVQERSRKAQPKLNVLFTSTFKEIQA